MKFRKILSAVTALAMSASAVAGLAVTASATSVTTNYKVDEILYGTPTYDTDGETITAVEPQTDFTDDANVTTLSTANTVGGTTFLEDSVLKASNGITMNFDSPVSSGIVHFSTSYTTLAGNGNTNHIKLVDEDGNAVLALYPVYSSNATYTTLNVVTIGSATESFQIYGPKNATYNIDVTIDLDAGTYSGSFTYASVGSSGSATGTTTTALTGGELDDSITNIAGLSTIVNSSYEYYMDNVYLYHETSTATQYPYTINYIPEGETEPVKVKEGKSIPTTITAESSFTTDDGQKYYITDEEAPTLEVVADGENTLDVTVRKAYTYNVKAVASYDSNVVLADTTVVEGETAQFGFPKYAIANGNLYTATKEQYVSGKYYTYIADNVTEDINETVEYTLTEEDTNAYDFIEAESVFGEAEGTVAEYADQRASGDAFGALNVTADNAKTITTLPAGAYTITAYAYATSSGTSTYINVGDENVVHITGAAERSGTDPDTDPTHVFVITEPTDVTVYASTTSSTVALDYVLIRKIAPEVVATMNTADTLPTLTDLKLVSGETGETPEKGKKVTTYTIKVKNYVSGVPTLNFNEEIETGAGTTLTPSGTDVTYGYQGTDDDSDYYIFVIQTLNIDDAASVSFPDVDDPVSIDNVTATASTDDE